MYLEQRFQELTGPRAFFFPENHSLSHTDIKVFQVLGLLEGRFYYYYVTKEINTGQEVHALASYEYETERYKSLYENPEQRGRIQTHNTASTAISPRINWDGSESACMMAEIYSFLTGRERLFFPGPRRMRGRIFFIS